MSKSFETEYKDVYDDGDIARIFELYDSRKLEYFEDYVKMLKNYPNGHTFTFKNNNSRYESLSMSLFRKNNNSDQNEYSYPDHEDDNSDYDDDSDYQESDDNCDESYSDCEDSNDNFEDKYDKMISELDNNDPNIYKLDFCCVYGSGGVFWSNAINTETKEFIGDQFYKKFITKFFKNIFR